MRVSLVSLKLNHQVHVPTEKQIPCRHHGVFDLFLEVEPPPLLVSELRKKKKDLGANKRFLGKKNKKQKNSSPTSQVYDMSS